MSRLMRKIWLAALVTTAVVWLAANRASAQATGSTLTGSGARTGTTGTGGSTGAMGSTISPSLFNSGSSIQGSGSGAATGYPGATGTATAGPGTTTGRTTGTGSTAVPSSSNPFGASYVNPLGAATNKKFGQPMYAAVATAATGLTGQTGQTNGTDNGFTTYGYRRAPTYSTTLSDDIPLVVHAPTSVRSNVTQVLVESTRLKSGKSIDVAVDGNVVVLRGNVADDRERRFAESLVRLTPGVRDVRNELQVVANSVKANGK